jgi:hypothetical protein
MDGEGGDGGGIACGQVAKGLALGGENGCGVGEVGFGFGVGRMGRGPPHAFGVSFSDAVYTAPNSSSAITDARAIACGAFSEAHQLELLV